MQYDVSTPAEYLEKIENDWRKNVLLRIREVILSSGADIKESIEYKMLRYGNDDKSIFHLNAQRAYVSLYVGNISKIENAGDLLKGFDTGKGCIRIKKEIAGSGLKKFILEAIKLWKEGKDIDC